MSSPACQRDQPPAGPMINSAREGDPAARRAGLDPFPSAPSVLRPGMTMYMPIPPAASARVLIREGDAGRRGTTLEAESRFPGVPRLSAWGFEPILRRGSYRLVPSRGRIATASTCSWVAPKARPARSGRGAGLTGCPYEHPVSKRPPESCRYRLHAAGPPPLRQPNPVITAAPSGEGECRLIST